MSGGLYNGAREAQVRAEIADAYRLYFQRVKRQPPDEDVLQQKTDTLAAIAVPLLLKYEWDMQRIRGFTQGIVQCELGASAETRDEWHKGAIESAKQVYGTRAQAKRAIDDMFRCLRQDPDLKILAGLLNHAPLKGVMFYPRVFSGLLSDLPKWQAAETRRRAGLPAQDGDAAAGRT